MTWRKIKQERGERRASDEAGGFLKGRSERPSVESDKWKPSPPLGPGCAPG